MLKSLRKNVKMLVENPESNIKGREEKNINS